MGGDIYAIFQPGAIEGFTRLMRPALQTVCIPSGDPDRPVAFRVAGAGSHVDADDTKALWESFSAIKTIYSRVEPLCKHERKLYRSKLIPRFAILYTKAFPSKIPTPKVHCITFHTADQADACGSIGQFCVAVIDAAHVADNEFRRRYAAVTDLMDNLRLRYRAYCHAANSTVASLKSATRKKVGAETQAAESWKSSRKACAYVVGSSFFSSYDSYIIYHCIVITFPVAHG